MDLDFVTYLRFGGVYSLVLSLDIYMEIVYSSAQLQVQMVVSDKLKSLIVLLYAYLYT